MLDDFIVIQLTSQDRRLLRRTLSPQYNDPNCSYDSCDDDRFTIDQLENKLVFLAKKVNGPSVYSW